MAVDELVTLIHDTPNIPIAVREFCDQNEIGKELRETLRLTRHHFVMTCEPWLEVASDPECDEQALNIHVRVSGDIDEVSERWKAFLDAFVDSINPDKQRHINVIYHPA